MYESISNILILECRHGYKLAINNSSKTLKSTHKLLTAKRFSQRKGILWKNSSIKLSHAKFNQNTSTRRQQLQVCIKNNTGQRSWFTLFDNPALNFYLLIWEEFILTPQIRMKLLGITALRENKTVIYWGYEHDNKKIFNKLEYIALNKFLTSERKGLVTQ